jgi:hypothetical protein
MQQRSRVSIPLVLAFVSFVSLGSAREARADCRCLAIAGDLAGALQAEVARADMLYARGDFDAALAIYARAYASAREPSLLFAQAMTRWQLGAAADARALFRQYLAVGGTLAYKVKAEAHLRELGDTGVAVPVVGGVVGTAGGVVGGLTGRTRGVAGGVVGGTVAGTAGVVGGLDAGIRAKAKPPKLAGTAATVLGVVAIASLAAVGIHAIAAGLKDDISLDAKFDLGLGLSGATVGITAIYLNGLTAATAATGSLMCDERRTPRKRRGIIAAPVAMPGGGGVVGALSF